METVIYRNRCYEFVDINSKNGAFYQATFAKYAHGNGRSLMDVYERPSIAKQEAWARLNLIHDFVTVTSYSCHFFYRHGHRHRYQCRIRLYRPTLLHGS